MQLSYWEKKSWLTDIGFTVVGSGIVGLNCAIALSEKYPDARILVLERGILPQGASTKNAGFACFGSLSEIIDDLEKWDENAVVTLIEQRWTGLLSMRDLLGDRHIGFSQCGGYEIFDQDADIGYWTNQLHHVNRMLRSVFDEDVFQLTSNRFGFESISDLLISNRWEGQIDTGMMMKALIHQVSSRDITILNMVEVLAWEEYDTHVSVSTNHFDFDTNYLCIATNGLSRKILDKEVLPARNQVLVTTPISGLPFRGTFHFDRGYYYFRNVDSRVLIGGGRHLDAQRELTMEMGHTDLIINQLIHLLDTVILPHSEYRVDQIWSGIMGVGVSKKPIVERLSPRTSCGIRLGGMGVAIGTQVGKQLAEISS